MRGEDPRLAARATVGGGRRAGGGRDGVGLGAAYASAVAPGRRASRPAGQRAPPAGAASGARPTRRPASVAAGTPVSAGPRATVPLGLDLRLPGEPRRQRAAEVPGRLEAVGGLLGHRAGERRVDPRTQLGARRARRGRRLVHVREEPRGRRALKRRLARQRLEGQAAQRVDVGARVGRLAEDLLGRRVVDGARPTARSTSARSRTRPRA